VLTSWDLAEKYNTNDIDGTRPNWGRYFITHILNKPPDPTSTSPNQRPN
jgi:hypothetical protein